MRAFGLLILCCFLSACAGSSSPTRYYTLAPLAEHTLVEAQKLKLGSVGIGPIEMPPYLDRQEIVLPTTLHRRDLAEFDQWIEPLKANMTRVLTEDVSVLLGDGDVYGFPWSSSLRVKTQVLIDVVQFDGIPGKQATLIARWTAVDGEDRHILISHRVKFTEPVVDPSYEALADAMSKALLALGQDIARKLPKTSVLP